MTGADHRGRPRRRRRPAHRRARARLAAGLRPTLVYVVTNFQNPSGATLSEPRRHHLAALADRYGFVLVEDDPYGELRFRGESAPPPRHAAPATPSPSAPRRRSCRPACASAGWSRPPWLMGPWSASSRSPTCTPARSTSCVVADLLADDAFMAAPRRATCARPTVPAPTRWSRAVRADAGRAASRSRRPDGGMFAGPASPTAATPTSCSPGPSTAGVAFVPGSAFHRDGTGRDTLRLCFSTLTAERAGVEAIDRLASGAGSTTTSSTNRSKAASTSARSPVRQQVEQQAAHDGQHHPHLDSGRPRRAPSQPVVHQARQQRRRPAPRPAAPGRRARRTAARPRRARSRTPRPTRPAARRPGRRSARRRRPGAVRSSASIASTSATSSPSFDPKW